MLPDGRLFVVGATGHTALYTLPSHHSHPGTWAAGPDLPRDARGYLQLAPDMPGILLPCGQVLFMGGPAGAVSTHAVAISPVVFLYDPHTNATPAALSPQPPSPQGDGRLLLLPTGQVLYASGTSGFLEVLTIDEALVPAPRAHWRPVITHAPSRIRAGHTFELSGRQLNGLSQVCAYGDDAQMATNYPIARLTDHAGHVIYLRTFDFSTLGIATGHAVVSTRVHVPAGIAPGRHTLHVIANGNPSEPFEVEIHH